MKSKFLTITLPVLLLACCSAATGLIHAKTTIPPGGTGLLPDDWCQAANFSRIKGVTSGGATAFSGEKTGWRLQVRDGNTSLAKIQFSVPLTGGIQAGDRLLLAFEMRCVPEASDGGVGEGRISIEMKDPPNYTKLGQDVFRCTGEWKQYHIPVIANLAAVPGKTFASFMLGGRRQSLELAGLRLLNYGKDFPLDQLPRPYLNYPGREEDAPWRKAALDRIEKIRTTEIAVEVVDASGKPIPGATVEAELQRHAFIFGTAVKAKYFSEETSDAKRYREILDENFSAIVLENDLKPFSRKTGASNTGKEYRHEWSRQAMSWAKERRMKVRGHYLCWGPWEKWSESLKAEPAKIRERILRHMEEVLHAGEGYVDVWDAVNHAVGWEAPRRTIDQALGPDFYAEVFREARKRTSVPLCINEDQVFRPGRQQDDFYDCIKDLISRGVVPDTIGNQAHFDSSWFPGPEELIRVSDRFAALVPRLELTELDIVTNGDEQLQADYLRDVLTMAYSHSAYKGVTLWVFWDGAGWKPTAGLWRKDWSEKPAGAVWRQLVRDLWLTKASGTTTASGAYRFRGHRGHYQVRVTVAGKSTEHWLDTESGGGRLRIIRQ